MDEQKKGGNGIVWVVVVLVVLVALYGAFKYIKKDSSTDTTDLTQVTTPTPLPTPTPTPTESPTPTPVVSTSVYKDGTYTATGEYLSPGGLETVKVSLTLKDDLIVDATVVPQATRPNSVKYQGLFESGYKAFVVGKSIDSVLLTKVSGSSLTPKGFNDAVAQIKVSAKA